MRVNLGCGARKMAGWVNVDAQSQVKPEVCRALEAGLPFADNSVEVFNARAILEHVPPEKLIFVMREIYRCLKPGGLLYMLVPHWSQSWMWADPTHYTAWDIRMIQWFTGNLQVSGLNPETSDINFAVRHYHAMLFADAHATARKFGVSLHDAAEHLSNVIEAHIWWLRKPGDGGPDWNTVREEIGASGIFPNGYENPDGGYSLGSTRSLPPALRNSPEMALGLAASPQRNKILWIANVAWLGGTALWLLETIRAMPQPWVHSVMYMSGEEEPKVAEQFHDAGVEFAKAPAGGLTKELINGINPAAVVLSNTNPNAIAKPWTWLTRNWPVFYVHHSAVTPWLPGARADIFVSEYLKRRYSNLIDRMHHPLVVPTGIDFASFAAIPRPRSPREKIKIGCLSSLESKFDRVLAKSVMEKVYHACKERNVDGDFAVLSPETKCAVSWGVFGSMRPAGINAVDFFSGIDIYFYPATVDETWGRTVAEAHAAGIPSVVSRRGGLSEIVKQGETGYLCDNADEFERALIRLVDDAEHRDAMGRKAREHALANWRENQFKKHVEPLILDAVLRG